MSGSAPVNVDIPAVIQNDNVLNCTMGNWEGEPTAYAYQWTRDGTNVGTDSAEHNLTPSDVGKTFNCVVTATNAAGSTQAPPSDGVVISEDAVGSAPATPDQIQRAFKAVRAQGKFQDTRAAWIGRCEHYYVSLVEALAYCQGEAPETHLTDISDRLGWAIEDVTELRGEATEIVPPTLPEPPADPADALSEEQTAAAKRFVKALALASELQLSVIRQCDQIDLTLQVSKQWCAEEDAAEHLEEITNGVHGAMEQTARLRSTLGSTQS